MSSESISDIYFKVTVLVNTIINNNNNNNLLTL